MAGTSKLETARSWRPQFYFGFGFRKFVTDVEHSKVTKTHEERKNQVYQEIDRSHLQKWVVFVAGVGFFTDAYDLFAINTVIPMLQYAYPELGSPNPNQGTQRPETAMLCATLAGTLVGQLAFGFLADKLGRRKMYGLELIVLICSTVGLTMCAKGEGSMAILGWLIFMRFAMGLGLGGDYPLSATIASEFAPKRHRARMLAWVFFCQSIGQLFAMLVSLVVTYLYRVPLESTTLSPTDPNYLACSQNPICLAAVDSTWRWVIGFGAIPAAIAVLFRITIPESPRFIFEVATQDQGATEEVEYFFNVDDDDSVLDDDEKGDEPFDGEPTGIEMVPRSQNGDDSISPAPRNADNEASEPSPRTSFLQHNLNANSVTAVNRSRNSASPSTRIPSSSGAEGGALVQKTYQPGLSSDQNQSQSTAWDYFMKEGNWRYLTGCALSWFLVDFCFYGLGLNNSKFVGRVWPKVGDTTVYSDLIQNSTHSLVVVAIGAILGSAAMIKVVKHWSTKSIQFWGFVVLSVLLFVLGTIMWLSFSGQLASVSGSQGSLITLYVLCQIAFNLGPNATTYMIPAEVFPTKWRASCHGFSAACGKLGSIIVQVFVAYATFGTAQTTDEYSWLGHVLQVFAGFAALGALVTYFWVPDTRDANGKPMSLEELAKGWAFLQEVKKAKRRGSHGTADEERADVREARQL